MVSDKKSQEPRVKPQRNRHVLFFSTLTTAMILFSYALYNWSAEYTLCSPSGRIYTVNNAQPKARCLTIKGDRIASVDDNYVIPGFQFNIPWLNWNLRVQSSLVSYIPSNEIVVPGLADAHAHVLENGWMLQLPLTGSSSVQEVVERIRNYILNHPDVLNDPNRWIEGMGWDQTKWEDKGFPTADDLAQDPLLRGRPISLSRVDGHARWVSPRVLELMEPLPSDDEVAGGLILRDDYGHPTGIFVDNAMNLIPIPPWSQSQMEEYFTATVKLALQYGLTSIHDADTKPDMIDFFRRKVEKETIPMRLYLMGGVPLPSNNTVDSRELTNYIEEGWQHKIPRLINFGQRGRLTLRSVKLFADGALGSWGAALLAPYSDKPESRGMLLQPPEILRAAVRRYQADKMQVNVHCIGDRANRVVLDIFEELIAEKKINVSDWRPRIEHAQIIDLNDLERFGKLSIIPSVQPTHATSDMWYAEKRLGSQRIQGAYAYGSLLRLSYRNTLPLGSDFPVEGVNPLLGFYAAVKRLAVDGTSPHGPKGWYPNQRLSRAEALKGMTLDPAYASFQEHEIGSLEVGKKADFVVFDRDFVGCGDETKCDGSEILEAKVKAVVVDGEVVWGKLPDTRIISRVRQFMTELKAFASWFW